MRALTAEEKNLIVKFANRLESERQQKLLRDLNGAIVKSDAPDGGLIVFGIEGYERPPHQGQHTYGIEGKMLDDDDAELSVLLYADPDDHLLELEFLRWDEEVIRKPRWETLELFS